MKKVSLILTQEKKGSLTTQPIEVTNETTPSEISQLVCAELMKTRFKIEMLKGKFKNGFNLNMKFDVAVKVGNKIYDLTDSEIDSAITFRCNETKNKFGDIVRTRQENFMRNANRIGERVNFTLSMGLNVMPEVVTLDNNPFKVELSNIKLIG